MPDEQEIQFAPELDVRRIVPLVPTTIPTPAGVKSTSYSVLLVPGESAVQFVPPLVVFKIVPPSPAANPVLEFNILTLYNELPWGSGFCQTHCAKVTLLNAKANANKIANFY